MAKAIKMVWGYTFFTKPPFTNDLAQNPEHHTATNDFRMVGDPGSCGLDWLNAPKKHGFASGNAGRGWLEDLLQMDGFMWQNMFKWWIFHCHV